MGARYSPVTFGHNGMIAALPRRSDAAIPHGIPHDRLASRGEVIEHIVANADDILFE